MGAFPCISVASAAEGVLTKHGMAFAENPPASWFAFLWKVDALSAKHGKKREGRTRLFEEVRPRLSTRLDTGFWPNAGERW